jgi:lipopolysaccharide/colanic/teichoic acid biosynthesis glycosyltransferase
LIKGDGVIDRAKTPEEDQVPADRRASDVESTESSRELLEESDLRVAANAIAGEDGFHADIKPLLTRRMPIWKRIMDITGALLALIMFLPLFLAISLLIKVASPGPILFKQDRIGYGGRRFSFLKFRTMKPDADPSTHQEYLAELINNGKAKDDAPMIKLDDHNPQIIPFGKFIRKTYLDELPQLFNVLRGDMSLVGPRPPIPYEVAEYRMWHNGRFNTIPGMTGLWQVSGKNRLTFKEMIRLDIQYYRNLSFLSDLKILFMTPFAIFSELMANRREEDVLEF